MASVQTLARPYARAAFEVARATDALAAWSSKLTFAAGVAGHTEALAAFASPHLLPAELVRWVMPEGEAADSAFARFLAELGDHRRLPILAEVASQFDALRREHEGVLKVTVSTAVALTGPQADTLRVALQRRFQRTIELDNRIDEALLGGALIDADGVVIDGSVRGRLISLKAALSEQPQPMSERATPQSAATGSAAAFSNSMHHRG